MKKKRSLSIILVLLLSIGLIACENSDKLGDKNTEKNIEESNSSDREDIVKEEEDSNKENIDKKTKTEDSKKEIYIKKLEDIHVGLSDLDKYYSGNTVEMKYAANEEYERWDDILNEIYAVLKEQLSFEEMQKVEKEQVLWIANKEAKAKKDSLQYEGGTQENVEYASSLAKTTKSRCYELVDKYMK